MNESTSRRPDAQPDRSPRAIVGPTDRTVSVGSYIITPCPHGGVGEHCATCDEGCLYRAFLNRRQYQEGAS